MRKFKIFLWLLLLAVLSVFVWQNKAFFMTRQSFHIDPWLAGPYSTPELPIVVICAGLFLLGFLIAYVYGLYGYLKQSKTIKHLNTTVAAQTEEIQALRRRVEELEQPPAAEAVVDPPPEASTADA
ncbi:MAG TPA: DUF1049 domain-containing protein [Desulfobacteraceae bacterium]|nr:DUF1049 domain-containing protein [Deltaproteobacteria bacterium]MBW2355222.1 DUF1049 domain-containing protein [Deltaproteobacteria bacterium]RLB97447.1 MAG: hypothetical protein DRH76_04875 [Deltaproteobacteria bacterium]HDI60619.1 DUF1049 domain-containing protein [Desulfobacteraceae bacterium]